MSYVVLARKWRPQSFQDVVGQTHITKSLQNSIVRNQIGHAYLFSGTRGVGKTTVARIFARALRCENLRPDGNPCGECVNCQASLDGSDMNIQEIDGASHNSVENVRELISNVQYLPSRGKYKIYVIDEVHMLSTSAFNALLKTLEEPPEHVVFILATTEPEKLLDTVLSRCQRFDFKNATLPELMAHVKRIASSEGIEFESDGLVRQICEEGQGSFRDTLSLLDQVLTYSLDKKITEQKVTTALGLAGLSSVRRISAALIVGDVKACSTIYRGLISENVNLKSFVKTLLDHLYKVIECIDSPQTVQTTDFPATEILQKVSAQELFWMYEILAKDTVWALESISPEHTLEIVLQKICLRRSFFTQEPMKLLPVEEINIKIEVPEKKLAPVEQVEEAQEEETQETQEAPEVESVAAEMPSAPTPTLASAPPEESQTKVRNEKTWENFLTFLFEKSPASASNLEQGNIIEEFDPNQESVVVRLGFPEEGKVFYDYLNETAVKEKLLGFMREFFERTEVDLSIELVQREDTSEFMTRAELEREKILKQQAEAKASILANPMLKEAEKIFGNSVDKVILN